SPLPLGGSGRGVVLGSFHADNGLIHQGDPEEEVIVLEEPEGPRGDEPRVGRAPRMPTPKEIEAHEATRIPHEGWCEFCMAGRG
ncbi:hypothetical protein N9L68_07065, partial [bacterium]|nr:hypothetical protein [bacterium]